MDIESNFLYSDLIANETEIHRSIDDASISRRSSPEEAFIDFSQGAGDAVAAYLAEDNENCLKHELNYGPQTITEETKQGQIIVNALLQNYKSVKFFKNKSTIFVSTGKHTFNFTNLIKGLNFNHLILKSDQLIAYNKLLDSQYISYKSHSHGYDNRPTDEQYFMDMDPRGICSTISLAEKRAINIYTGGAHYGMNALMRGLLDDAIKANHNLPSYYSSKEKLNYTLKEFLLHCAVAVHGLKQLPDYDPPEREDKTKPQYLYRGEGGSTISTRIEAVQEGGKVTLELGFISTSYDRPSGIFVNSYTPCGVLLVNVSGKDITPLSMFGEGEREVLLPPTQIQWMYHKEIPTKESRTMHLFLALPVRVPVEKPTIKK